MKISEYVRHLEEIQADFGDLEVETVNFNFDRVSARKPTIDHMAILFGRESKPRVASWFKYSPDYEQRKGEMICLI